MNWLATGFNAVTAGIGWSNALVPGQSLNFSIAEDTSGGTVITFTGFELPESLKSLGGIQQHSIHEFPGGFKTLQTLGPFPQTLSWSGLLLGDSDTQTPMQRALQMDTLRRRGNEVTLKYGSLYSWKGVVVKFDFEVKHQNYIVYMFTFEVVEDNAIATPASTTSSPSTLFGSLYNQLKTSVSTALGLSAASIAALTAFTSAVDAALLPAAGILTAIDPVDATNIAVLASAASIALRADALSSVLGTAVTAVALVNLVKTSAALIPTPTSGGTTPVPKTRTVRVVNPHFPTLATAYLKDPTRWPEIASLNGVQDVRGTGVMAVQIPLA